MYKTKLYYIDLEAVTVTAAETNLPMVKFRIDVLSPNQANYFRTSLLTRGNFIISDMLNFFPAMKLRVVISVSIKSNIICSTRKKK